MKLLISISGFLLITNNCTMRNIKPQRLVLQLEEIFKAMFWSSGLFMSHKMPVSPAYSAYIAYCYSPYIVFIVSIIINCQNKSKQR
jgi:hypothetical protein